MRKGCSRVAAGHSQSCEYHRSASGVLLEITLAIEKDRLDVCRSWTLNID
jgi:hypothetical protein